MTWMFGNIWSAWIHCVNIERANWMMAVTFHFFKLSCFVINWRQFDIKLAREVITVSFFKMNIQPSGGKRFVALFSKKILFKKNHLYKSMKTILRVLLVTDWMILIHSRVMHMKKRVEKSFIRFCDFLNLD